MDNAARMLFSFDPRWPVGQSLRDPQWSFRRGVNAIAKAVRDTPAIEVERAALRGIPATRVRLAFEWLGPDPSDVPLSPEEALLTGRSVCVRYRVQATVAVSNAEGALLNRDRCALALEVPLVIGGTNPETCAPPPETGYMIVRGSEYCLRYHERFAFGTWIVLLNKKGVANASMRIPPREVGELSRSLRVTLGSGAFVTCMKRKTSLGAILAYLGDTEETFRARMRRSVEIAWPSSREHAESIITADVSRIVDAETPEIGDAASFVARVILPHVQDVQDKLEMLAHACDLMAAAFESGSCHDLDDLQHKRMDAPGDMLASHVGATWTAFVKKLPQEMMVEALPVHHTRTADTIDIGSVVGEARGAPPL